MFLVRYAHLPVILSLRPSLFLKREDLQVDSGQSSTKQGGGHVDGEEGMERRQLRGRRTQPLATGP